MRVGAEAGPLGRWLVCLRLASVDVVRVVLLWTCSVLRGCRPVLLASALSSCGRNACLFFAQPSLPLGRGRVVAGANGVE
jgi:hypothetical protein